MAPAPSKRAQRQAKKGMIQPALPLLPSVVKKKVEPTSVSDTSSVDDKGTTPSQGAELDTKEQPQVVDTRLNGNHSSGDSGSPQDRPYEQVMSEAGAAEAQAQTWSRPAEPGTIPNSIYDDIREKVDRAVANVRRSSASLSQSEAAPVAPSTTSESNLAGKSAEYPGVVAYETSHYGQATKLEMKTPEATDALNSDLETRQDFAIEGTTDSHNSGMNAGERSSIESEAQQYSEQNSTSGSMLPAETMNGGGGPPKTNSQSSAWPTVTDHLLQLSHNKAWADWVIAVEGGKSQPFVTYAHGIMLARSPRLRKLMERQPPSPQGNVINLAAPMPINPHAFEAAVRFLYSDTVLLADSLFPDGPPARINFLPYILSYWVSGVVLGIDMVVDRSVQLLREFLDWDVLEAVIKEADDLGAGVNKDNLRSFPDWPNVVTQWKAEALSFCAARMNLQEFNLDADPISTIIRARFAALEERPLKHNPALASMVFGSMPTPTDLSPVSPKSEIMPSTASPQDQTVSHILLNIDYHDLVLFSQQLRQFQGGTACLQLLEKLVHERENQRLLTISNRAIPNKKRMANSEIWDVAAYREYLDNGELRRERVRFLLPTK